MKSTNTQSPEFLLRKAASKFGQSLASNGQYRWLWEGERWNELVFALLAQTLDIPEADVRQSVGMLDSLDLLDIAQLAEIPVASSKEIMQDELGRRIIAVLTESGADSGNATRGLVTICEAARSIRDHFQGGIQHFLRRHGEMMRDDAIKVFGFTALAKKEANYAVTYWLQNVCNMPIPLYDVYTERFCKANGINSSQWIDAADRLDLNLAFADDLLRLAATTESTPGNGATRRRKRQAR